MPCIHPHPQRGVHPSFGPATRRLVVAMAAAWSLCVPTVWAQTGTAPASTSAATQTYAIAPGSLAQVIGSFAAQAGIALTFEASAMQGQTSPGVQGSYTIESGLRRALESTDWTARRTSEGVYMLERRSVPDTRASHTLPAVTVTASALNEATTEGSGSYGATATTVFKGTQSIRQTPQPVTVVTRQMMEDRGLLDLTDVLQNVPGVTVDYTDSERVNYYSRGFQIDSLQIDGLNVSQAGSIFIQPDTAVLDRIEILRGAAGMLRGSGNPSATVNLVRKRPTSEFQGSAGLTLGSWNRRRLEADVSGPLNEAGTLRGRVVAVADDKEFFQKARDEKRRVIYGVLEADLSPRTTFTASLQHSEIDATGAWGGLPSNFDGTQLNLPRNTYLGTDWNRWNRNNQQALAELEHRFDNDWKVKLSAAHTRFRMQDNGFMQTSFSRGSTTNPYLVNVSTSIYSGDASDQDVISLSANGPFQLLGRKHQLTAGVETQRVKTTGTSGYYNVNPVTGIDIRDFDPYSSLPKPDPGAGSGTYYGGTVNNVRQQAAYATGRFSLADPLTAIVGARVSWWEYEAPAAPAGNYGIDREITPYAGLVYDISKSISAYASYSGIFAPQTATDISGRVLKPVRGKDYEAGLKGEFLDGRLNTSLSLFRIKNEGRAVDDANSPNPCPSRPTGFCQIAGGVAQSEGWELEAAGEITPGWRLMAGYTNTRTKYLLDTVANTGQPIRTADPRHLLRLFTTYKLQGALRDVTVGGGVQAQSDTYVRSGAITGRQGGYAVYNAMLGYQVNRAMRVQLNVNNIFDKYYYKKIGVGNAFNTYYGDPRNVTLTLSYKF